jgi:hypothetical protein
MAQRRMTEEIGFLLCAFGSLRLCVRIFPSSMVAALLGFEAGRNQNAKAQRRKEEQNGPMEMTGDTAPFRFLRVCVLSL